MPRHLDESDLLSRLFGRGLSYLDEVIVGREHFGDCPVRFVYYRLVGPGLDERMVGLDIVRAVDDQIADISFVPVLTGVAPPVGADCSSGAAR